MEFMCKIADIQPLVAILGRHSKFEIDYMK